MTGRTRNKISIFLFLNSCIFSPEIFAQASLSHYQKHCSFLLQNEGKWVSTNKDYKEKEEWSARYFGYEFSKGINDNTIHLKIMGYTPAKSEWVEIWNGYYTWSPKRQKALYHSVSAFGVVVDGESESIGENEISMIFTATTPHGTIEKSKEIMKLVNDKIESKEFTMKSGKWSTQKNITWSPLELPKGNLSFMSSRDGNWEIYSMDAKGDNLRNLSCNKATDYAFSYFPQSARLAFYTNRDGNDEIYIQEADGKKVTNLTNHSSTDRIPTISPDGKQVLFISNRDHQQGELYKMDADGRNLKRLTQNEYFEDAGTWSNDGKKVYFTRELRDLKDTSANAVGNGEIFVMDADGANEKQLTNRPGYDGGAQLSPDGKKITFYGKSEKGHYDIFMMDADGKNLVNLTGDSTEDYSPSWSPDGKWIAFTRGDSRNYDIWLLHLPTMIKWRITTHPRRDESPFWQPVQ